MIDLDPTVLDVIANANEYRRAAPTLGTLLEEIAEYARALECKHPHSPEYELVQIGGIVINLLRQRYRANSAFDLLSPASCSDWQPQFWDVV